MLCISQEKEENEKMKKKLIRATMVMFIVVMQMMLLCSCGSNNEGDKPGTSGLTGTPIETTKPSDSSDNGSSAEAGNVSDAGSSSEAEAAAVEKLTDDQALDAIMNYCTTINPDLESMVNSEDYTVFWEISSSDEQQVVVLYRSYTGAEVRYYVDRTTGDTYVTEFVLGITDEEQRTDESLNARDYL